MPESELELATALFADPERLGRVLGRAVRTALRDHKRDGDPVVVWRDGKVVWLAANEIPVDLEETEGDLT